MARLSTAILVLRVRVFSLTAAVFLPAQVANSLPSLWEQISTPKGPTYDTLLFLPEGRKRYSLFS